MIKLIIPRIPVSGNKIRHWHWVEKQAYADMWYDEIMVALRQYTIAFLKRAEEPSLNYLPLKKAKIDFYIYFPKKHRRDKINYAQGLKGALDGLVKCGIIKDDNWNRIEDQYYQRIDEKNPRIEIIINNVKESKNEQQQ